MSTLNIPNRDIVRAVRYAVETCAEIRLADDKASVAFTTEARRRLQVIITSEYRLADAADFCDVEMKRHVAEERDMRAALGALCLKQQLHEICRRQRRFGDDAEQGLRPLG